MRAYRYLMLLLITTGLLAQQGTPSKTLELTLELGPMFQGTPQDVTFVFVNNTQHDLRLPDPTIECSDVFTGSLRLRKRFTPLKPTPPGLDYGCFADTVKAPPIIERINSWKLLHPGESLRFPVSRMALHMEVMPPGTYDLWADYSAPYISPADAETLAQLGIEVPHGEIHSPHVVFTTKP